MKKALFLLLLLSLLGQSCGEEKEPEGQQSANINSMSVIIDELLWNGAVGDSIRNKFASPVVGLPQEEPLFTINQYPVKLLEGYKANSRNIIVIKKGVPNHFEIRENEYRNPQIVVYIYGKTSRDIVKIIEEHSTDIIKRMRNGEIAEENKRIQKSLLNQHRIMQKFKVVLDIPTTYKYVLEKPKFLWLKKEIISGNTSILIYEIPYSSIQPGPNVVNHITRVRDSIGKLYIHGTIPDTQMVTEDSYSPYLYSTKIGNRLALETKGTWELNKDFMSGPFINYCIFDKPADRILVVEGFCYAPSKSKRDLMLELEAIVKSVKFRTGKKS